MPYRDNKPIDPESLRPELTFWQRQRVKNWDSFFGLCSEQWFREWCGGVWLKGEDLYDIAVNACSIWATGAHRLTWWPVRDKPYTHCNGFKMCEWIPLMPVENDRSHFNIFYKAEDRSNESLMIIVDVQTRQPIMDFYNSVEKRWVKLAVFDRWLDGKLENYPHHFKLDSNLSFIPSLSALLDSWPDYWHMKKLGIVKGYNEK